MEPEQDESRRVLEEIRDDQKKLLAQIEQLVELARSQFEIVSRQSERTDKIQARTEAIQSRSEGLIGGARKTLYVILPIIFVLLIYVSWLIFRIMI